jgi:hypothetical protein
MASDIGVWPWKIDSATFAGEFTGGILTRQLVAMGTVLWVSDAAGAGDICLLQHVNDIWVNRDLWRSQGATGADFSDDYKFPDSVAAHGIRVTTLSSGLLYIYFR